MFHYIILSNHVILNGAESGVKNLKNQRQEIPRYTRNDMGMIERGRIMVHHFHITAIMVHPFYSPLGTKRKCFHKASFSS